MWLWWSRRVPVASDHLQTLSMHIVWGSSTTNVWRCWPTPASESLSQGNFLPYLWLGSRRSKPFSGSPPWAHHVQHCLGTDRGCFVEFHFYWTHDWSKSPRAPISWSDSPTRSSFALQWPAERKPGDSGTCSLGGSKGLRPGCKPIALLWQAPVDPYPGMHLQKEVRLPKYHAVLPHKHGWRHDYSECSLIPTQDECISFGSALFSKQWGLPLELKVDVPIHSPHRPEQSVGLTKRIMHCKTKKSKYVSL